MFLFSSRIHRRFFIISFDRDDGYVDYKRIHHQTKNVMRSVHEKPKKKYQNRTHSLKFKKRYEKRRNFNGNMKR